MFGASFLNPGSLPSPERMLEIRERWVLEGNAGELAERIGRLASVDPEEFKQGLNEGYELRVRGGDTAHDLCGLMASDSYRLGRLLAPVVDLLSDENLEWQEEDRE